MERKKLILAVRFFRTANGNEPARDFLKLLPKADRTAIGIDLKEVQYGWPLGMPLVRKMDAELWEVRSILRDAIARTLFTVSSNQMVVLHVFIKKSQQTPKNELALAINRLRTLKRHDHEE